MTPDVLRTIIDSAFKALEAKFAGHLLIVSILAMANAAIDSVLPVVVADLKAQGIQIT